MLLIRLQKQACWFSVLPESEPSSQEGREVRSVQVVKCCVVLCRVECLEEAEGCSWGLFKKPVLLAGFWGSCDYRQLTSLAVIPGVSRDRLLFQGIGLSCRVILGTASLCSHLALSSGFLSKPELSGELHFMIIKSCVYINADPCVSSFSVNLLVSSVCTTVVLPYMSVLVIGQWELTGIDPSEAWGHLYQTYCFRV